MARFGVPFSLTEHCLAVSCFVVRLPGGWLILPWRRRGKRRKRPLNLDRRPEKSMMLNHIHFPPKAKKGQSRGDDLLSDMIGGQLCGGDNKNLVLQICKRLSFTYVSFRPREWETLRSPGSNHPSGFDIRQHTASSK